MKVLISPVSLEGARIVAESDADIIDIKNTKEGSLGAQGPWVIKEIIDTFKPKGAFCSVALGDMTYNPGTCALAAYGAAHCGADYLKAGLFGATNYQEAYDMMSGMAKAIRMVSDDIFVVAAGYADYKKFGGVACEEIVKVAKDSGCDVAMLDTRVKDGSTLFDVLSMNELEEFVGRTKEAGMLSALAGSIKVDHLDKLFELDCDIIGIRGAACRANDRTSGIVREQIDVIMNTVNERR